MVPISQVKKLSLGPAQGHKSGEIHSVWLPFLWYTLVSRTVTKTGSQKSCFGRTVFRGCAEGWGLAAGEPPCGTPRAVLRKLALHHMWAVGKHREATGGCRATSVTPQGRPHGPGRAG